MNLTRLLARSSWHFYRRHPAQLLLSVLGITLGIAIVTAVLITNSSSQRAFALSSEALYGRTTYQLSGALGVDQSLYVELRRRYPNLAMAPVIQGHVSVDNQVFTLLGLDPFAEADFNRIRPPSVGGLDDATGGGTSRNALQALLNQDSLLVSATSAADMNWQVGQRIDMRVGGRPVSATLAGTFQSDNPAAASGLMMGDIALVQTLLQRGSFIDRIDLIIDDVQAHTLAQRLPKTLAITAATRRQQTMQAMTRGFHINLTAMSLLALVVGVFLIHNTMTFAVVQRRELFAIKRITGITARSLLLSLLAEAFCISLAGSLLGIALGYGVAHVLIGLTTQTINDLYFVLHVQKVWFNPWLILAGLSLGIGSSVLAASLSALDAAGTSPIQARQRSIIEHRTQRALPLFAASGTIIMLLGLLLALLPLQSLVAGFAALMFLILGYGLALPWLVRLITVIGQPLAARSGLSLSLAVAGIERNISRTGLAIAALTIAVSATFGVDIMIGSFRSTVDHWLGTTLRNDIYVSTPSTVSSQSSSPLDQGMDVRALAVPGVHRVSTGRTLEVATDAGSIDMLVIRPHEQTDAGFELLGSVDDSPAKAWTHWREADTIMISEPMATRHDLAVGDTLTLFTGRLGNQAFRIVAVFREFGSSHGKLLMSRATYSRYWQDERFDTLGLLLHDSMQSERVIDALRQSLSTPEHPLLIQSNTAIHRQSLAVFDRTFEVTRVLRWLTVGVAFIGIFSALLALHLERGREFAIIRAIGATRLQLMKVVVLQTFFMGLLAGLLALPLGWFMSEILIRVINVRSFGWTMHSMLPTGSLRDTLILGCVSAVLAGLYPAWRLSRADIIAQLHDD